MPLTVCPHCGADKIEEDSSRGNAVCTSCGHVLEENLIVSEVQFAESGGGGHSLIGQYVSGDCGQKVGIGGVRGLVGKASREITLQNGKRKIQELASQLRLNQACIDTAFNFYKMAVSRGLTRGRRSTHVIASCLYMTCRTNVPPMPHLLLDFSDAVQVNVFELGKTFGFLSRMLYISIPPTDPCLYVMRFANRLQFGDKEHEVGSLAMRLVQRMKRDWLATGRRPTGVCGAALLLAARYYNFNRTIADMVRVVNIGESVVRKRLTEFSATPSSALTLDEFMEVELEQEADPPAFTEARQKARQEQENKIAGDLLQQKDFNTAQRQVEAALVQKTKKSRSKYAKLTEYELTGGDPDLANCQDYLRNEIMDTVSGTVERKTPSPNIETQSEQTRFPGPTMESLGLTRPDPPTSEQTETTEGENNQLDMTGIDDDELDTYILSEPEVKLKTKIWMQVNGEFLQQMEERQKQRLEQESLERKDPSKRKPRRSRKQPIHAATPAEAIEKVIQEKKLSNKINYDVLRSLTGPSTSNEQSTAIQTESTSEIKTSPFLRTAKMEDSDSKSSVGRRRFSRPKPNVSATKRPRIDIK